jgi:hypothetical protein
MSSALPVMPVLVWQVSGIEVLPDATMTELGYKKFVSITI